MCNSGNAYGGGHFQAEQQRLEVHIANPTMYSHPSGNNANSPSQNWPTNSGPGNYDNYQRDQQNDRSDRRY